MQIFFPVGYFRDFWWLLKPASLLGKCVKIIVKVSKKCIFSHENIEFCHTENFQKKNQTHAVSWLFFRGGVSRKPPFLVRKVSSVPSQQKPGFRDTPPLKNNQDTACVWFFFWKFFVWQNSMFSWLKMHFFPQLFNCRCAFIEQVVRFLRSK